MPKFRVHRWVAFEFNAVRDWYAEHSPWAAENFVQRFNAALLRVQLRPTTQSPWHGIFRRVRLARFPYLLIFHTNQRITSVLALVHERKEPRRTFAQMVERKSAFR